MELKKTLGQWTIGLQEVVAQGLQAVRRTNPWILVVTWGLANAVFVLDLVTTLPSNAVRGGRAGGVVVSRAEISNSA